MGLYSYDNSVVYIVGKAVLLLRMSLGKLELNSFTVEFLLQCHSSSPYNTPTTELRQLAADTIKSNATDFLGFLESDIDSYCHQVYKEIGLFTDY